MNNTRLLLLLTKFKDGACSEEELLELEIWYHQLQTDNQLIDISNEAVFVTEMSKAFRNRLQDETPVIPLYRRTIFKIAVAASICILMTLAAFIQYNYSRTQGTIVAVKQPSLHDIAAPQNVKATITLDNGQKVLLDSINSGTVLLLDRVKIAKNKDGQLIYSGNALKPIYNTLFNPRGSKTISLTLHDGTKVWLNSESSLRYPIAFVGKERRVEITGEAYFEVSKDPTRKFIVTSGDVNTEVLGTHFNVNTYADESSIKVTLLEGSVKVSRGNATGLLVPGQQAQITSQIAILNKIDIDAVMAWKNGFFHFTNTSISDLLKQLARWYDIEIVFMGDIPQRTFGGEISRDSNLSEVLKILDEIKLKNRLEGKKIIIE